MKPKASDWYKKIWTLDIKNMSWVENTSNEVDSEKRYLGSIYAMYATIPFDGIFPRISYTVDRIALLQEIRFLVLRLHIMHS